MAAERAAAPRGPIVRAKAFAKINLSLRVLGSRPDGYHELRTVFQSIALHDTLTFQATRGAFRIICRDPACPTDATNLVWRAAERVWAAAGRRGAPRGVDVRIVKRIPVQAGLGGGSSDAAAALVALTALWRVRLTAGRRREIAWSLGADVPYFLEGGTVLGLERGDVLFALQDAAPAWIVLAIPGFGVSTRDAYGWFDQDAALSLVSRSGEISNDLQGPVAARFPEIARLVKALQRGGAIHAAMSGSGSAVFGLFDRRHEATAAAGRLARRGVRILVTRTLDRTHYQRSATD